MRVLMLGWEFPPHNSGGLGVACEGLAKALLTCDVEVLFVLPRRVGVSHPSVKLLFADTTKVTVTTVDTALSPYMTSSAYESLRMKLPSNIYGATLFEEVARYALAIRDIAQREQFDVIHAHDWLSFLAGIEAKRISKKPLILHVHATGYDQSGRNGVDSRVFAIERMGFEAADAIITVSGYTKGMVEQYYGTPAHKIHVVHNGVDAAKHEGERGDVLSLKRQGYKMVLFVGRLSLHKGPDYFLHAAKRVLQFYPNVYFVVSGSGEMEWQVIDLAAKLGIADKVFFAGFVRGAELDRLYRAADLYILPSVSEPFGITPLESLINGTPVLVSKQSGISEVLSHALKVDFWDADEMANQIVAVLKHAPLSKQLSDYGRDEAYRLTWRRAAEKCVDVYGKILQSCLPALR